MMAEEGFDLAERTPREISQDELANCDYVAAMGCRAEAVCPATWSEESRDWGLNDPQGKDIQTVREFRDEVERRVREFRDGVGRRVREFRDGVGRRVRELFDEVSVEFAA